MAVVLQNVTGKGALIPCKEREQRRLLSSLVIMRFETPLPALGKNLKTKHKTLWLVYQELCSVMNNGT